MWPPPTTEHQIKSGLPSKPLYKGKVWPKISICRVVVISSGRAMQCSQYSLEAAGYRQVPDNTS